MPVPPVGVSKGKMMSKWRLYPCRAAPYKHGHVAADDHKHYLPGGVRRSLLPGKGVRVCAPPFVLFPFDCREDATYVRRDNRL
jgi:hypothetical protein